MSLMMCVLFMETGRGFLRRETSTRALGRIDPTLRILGIDQGSAAKLVYYMVYGFRSFKEFEQGSTSQVARKRNIFTHGDVHTGIHLWFPNHMDFGQILKEIEFV